VHFNGGENLLSEALADLEKIRPEDLDKEILRAAMIAELDAINIYEQMANLAKSEEIRKILLDVARKEKIHVAMFETVLLQTDKEFLRIYSDYALARSKE
jgi:rubrerythrin